MSVHISLPEKQTKVHLNIFFFALDVTQTCCHLDDASRRQPFINKDNYTFLWICCSRAVNIFAGNQVVIPVVVPHSPGLPEMNPSMSRVSLCICAERKHDQLQLGTSLNKSLERLSHEPAGTPREKEGEREGESRWVVDLCNILWLYEYTFKSTFYYYMYDICMFCLIIRLMIFW